MEVTAQLKYVHIAPRKVRLVAGAVKGMGVERAERELLYRMKRASRPLAKLIRSAAANARHNFHIEDAKLTVKDIRVNPGPVTKRFRARAFGRASPIRRRTSHVVVVLETGGTAPARTRRAAPTVRDATRDDFRSREETRQAGEGFDQAKIRKPPAAGFMRRMFQRKAI